MDGVSKMAKAVKALQQRMSVTKAVSRMAEVS